MVSLHIRKFRYINHSVNPLCPRIWLSHHLWQPVHGGLIHCTTSPNLVPPVARMHTAEWQVVMKRQYPRIKLSLGLVGTYLKTVIKPERPSYHETNMENTEWQYRQNPIGARRPPPSLIRVYSGFSCASWINPWESDQNTKSPKIYHKKKICRRQLLEYWWLLY
jgi:hypothetical protein